MGVCSLLIPSLGAAKPEQSSWRVGAWEVFATCQIGAYLLWQKPSGWPFVGMFTYFIAGVINAVYCMLFVKEE